MTDNWFADLGILFRLPRPCRVRNIKTGRLEKTTDGEVLDLELTGRESCWFALLQP